MHELSHEFQQVEEREPIIDLWRHKLQLTDHQAMMHIIPILKKKPVVSNTWTKTILTGGCYPPGQLNNSFLNLHNNHSYLPNQWNKEQFLHVLIGSRNSKCPLLFTALQMDPKWRLVSIHIFWKMTFVQYMNQS